MNSQQNDTFLGTTGVITPATIGSFVDVMVVMIVSYTLANSFLPKSVSNKARLLFIWHAFDAGIHISIEVPWLYHTFFAWVPVPKPGETPTYSVERYTMPGVHFQGHEDRIYGIEYATSPFASLWKEYAKADRRVAGSDPSIVCMELICVFVITPFAIYTCCILSKGMERKAHFWMIIIAAIELCMNFIMFGPEWLTGWPNLDVTNAFYLWMYIIFFNAGLWVVAPLWVLWESYRVISSPLESSAIKRVEKSSF